MVSRSGLSGGSGHVGSESSTIDTPSSVSLPPSSRGEPTAVMDTESESTTLAVASVIATAPLTLTIVAGVTVIVDIPESRSPGGRAGRRVVDELRSFVVEGARPSFDVGLIGDCEDTVTSIPDLGSNGKTGDFLAPNSEGNRSNDDADLG